MMLLVLDVGEPDSLTPRGEIFLLGSDILRSSAVLEGVRGFLGVLMCCSGWFGVPVLFGRFVPVI